MEQVDHEKKYKLSDLYKDIDKKIKKQMKREIKLISDFNFDLFYNFLKKK